MSAKKQEEKRRLGRGLSQLIPGAGSELRGELRQLELDLIEPNPFQPRRNLDQAEIEELARSIEAHGLLQPLVVCLTGERYILIAGERRLRALKMLGRRHAPAIVRHLPEGEMLTQALVENLMRRDLSPLELAHSYRRLAEEQGLKHAQIAELLGLSRPAVTNTIRLLELPPTAQALIDQGDLTAGHGRALLMAPAEQRERLAVEALRRGWSVRELERRARRLNEGKGPKAKGPSPPPTLGELSRRLSDHLGAKATIRQTPAGAGSITIRFASTGELNEILRRMNLPDEW